MRASSHLKRLKTLQKKLYPQPTQERWLPTGVHLYQDENDILYFLPGQKQIWDRSQRAGITPDVYVNLHPDEDGCCNHDSGHGRDERCPNAQKLWDAIDLTSLERVPDESEVA